MNDIYGNKEKDTKDVSNDHLAPHELFKLAERLLAGSEHNAQVEVAYHGKLVRFFNYKGVVFQKGAYSN